MSLFCSAKWFDLYDLKNLSTPGSVPGYQAGDRQDVPGVLGIFIGNSPAALKVLKDTQTWDSKIHAYLACVSFMDAQLGKVLDALATSPHADNTIICLLSDHGYHLGEKGITGKNSLWDRSTRVPLLLSGPNLPKNKRNNSAVSLVDIYPTLTQLAGVEVQVALDGQVLPLDELLIEDRVAYTFHGPEAQTVRTATHRYIRYIDGAEELYAYEGDPFEFQNLASKTEYYALKETLRDKLIMQTANPLGNHVRLLELKNGIPHWQGKPITHTDKIPGP